MAIVSARPFHLGEVEGVSFRPADELECQAAGMTAVEAVCLSHMNSSACWVIEVDKEIAAFWGYFTVSLLSQKCTVWLLTTPIVEHHRVKFVRTTQRMIRELNECWPLLEVHVDSRYLDAVKWLRWLGFVETGINSDWSVPFLIMQRGT